MALDTYAKQVYRDHRRAKIELSAFRSNFDKVQTIASEEHEKMVALEQETQSLRQEVQRLQAVEKELQGFKERKPAIMHYLKIIPKMVEYVGLLSSLESSAHIGQTERADEKPSCVAWVSNAFRAPLIPRQVAIPTGR